jgi:hypothetical protein
VVILKEQQVPYRNDRQKSKGNCNRRSRSFALLRMTIKTANARATTLGDLLVPPFPKAGKDGAPLSVRQPGNSRFPSGMIDRKASAAAKTEADPLRG